MRISVIAGMIGLAAVLSLAPVGQAAARSDAGADNGRTNADAERNAGIAADRDGKPDDAAAHFTNYIALLPDKDEGYAWRGIEEIRLGRYDEAIADYTKAIAINPAEPAYYKSRGLAAARNGDYDAALADDSKAIELAPGDAPAYVNRGAVAIALKNYDGAIADFEKAIALLRERGSGDENGEEDLALAYANLGVARTATGEFERAAADLGEAIKRRPHTASSYTNRANAYLNLKRYENAIADCDTAIKLVQSHRNDDGNDKQDLALAYFNRGIAYQRSGKTAQGSADIEKAGSLNPNLRSAPVTEPSNE